MTTAPTCLLAARALLRDHLKIPPLALGVVGDTQHAGGGDSYHLGADQIRPRGTRDRYSVDESSRDRNGLTNDACALDVGWFEIRVGGKIHNLRTFSIWLVAQCKAGTADTRDLREVIYSPDGKTVKRWDRLGRRTSGDSSHLMHSHLSYFRDAIKAGRDQTALFRRYLAEIGLLAGEDDDMTPQELLNTTVASPNLGTMTVADWLKKGEAARREAAKANAKLAALAEAVATLGGPGASQALMDKLEEIDAEATARAAAEEQRDADLRTLVVQHQSGTLSAEEVVQRLAERLAT